MRCSVFQFSKVKYVFVFKESTLGKNTAKKYLDSSCERYVGGGEVRRVWVYSLYIYQSNVLVAVTDR